MPRQYLNALVLTVLFALLQGVLIGRLPGTAFDLIKWGVPVLMFLLCMLAYAIYDSRYGDE